MISRSLTESIAEEAALAWLSSLGYAGPRGLDIAVGMLGSGRSDPTHRDVVPESRSRQVLAYHNPKSPSERFKYAFLAQMRINAPLLLERNRSIHNGSLESA